MLAYRLEVLLVTLRHLLQELLGLVVLKLVREIVEGFGAGLFHCQEVFQLHQFFG
jgi:hypothetical protein